MNVNSKRADFKKYLISTLIVIGVWIISVFLYLGYTLHKGTVEMMHEFDTNERPEILSAINSVAGRHPEATIRWSVKHTGCKYESCMYIELYVFRNKPTQLQTDCENYTKAIESEMVAAYHGKFPMKGLIVDVLNNKNLMCTITYEYKLEYNDYWKTHTE